MACAPYLQDAAGSTMQFGSTPTVYCVMILRPLGSAKVTFDRSSLFLMRWLTASLSRTCLTRSPRGCLRRSTGSGSRLGPVSPIYRLSGTTW